MTNTEKAFFLFLIVLLCVFSIMLGQEIARVSNGVKSEIINKYKSGAIVCAQVADELVCREVKK